MQVLEWRITAPNSKVSCVPESKSFFPAKDLFTMYMGGKQQDSKEMEMLPVLYPKVRLTWTGSKVELVELIYAWETAGCFNHGHATIKEIVIYVENIFNIDLSGYYRMFCDIRNRVDRTAFLDKLIKFLKARMDEADRKK